jgi:hypothetical protein
VFRATLARDLAHGKWLSPQETVKELRPQGFALFQRSASGKNINGLHELLDQRPDFRV